MQRETALILVRTEGPVNIGLCARAMKNFGVKRLILVQAACNHLGKESKSYAAHACDILEQAEVYNTLAEALEDFDLVLGFSRREGQYRRRDLLLGECAEFLQEHGARRLALMLGNEKNGLSDEELRLAHLCVSIESGDEQPSLNLSHAAALALYTVQGQNKPAPNAAGHQDVQRGADSFLRILDLLHYFDSFERRERFAPYLQKILSRGIKEKQDATVVENLLLRLEGMLKRKLEGK